jgi:hypothetical protein
MFVTKISNKYFVLMGNSLIAKETEILRVDGGVRRAKFSRKNYVSR